MRVLTRDATKAAEKFVGVPGVSCHGPTQWTSALSGSRAVVNLAGEPIANRWDERVKGELLRSRVDATRAVVDAIASLPDSARPSVLVSSSAVGFYGVSESAEFDEASAPGDDFLGRLCVAWEAEAAKAEAFNVRVVTIRTGIVLARDGGALAKMLPVFQLFAGGPLGSGRQWFSWVHRDDLVSMLTSAVDDDAWRGAYNGTAPQPVRMGALCEALGRATGRPSWLPVPELALQTLLGEGATVVLEGQKVLPRRAIDERGFAFRYEDVDAALRDLA